MSDLLWLVVGVFVLVVLAKLVLVAAVWLGPLLLIPLGVAALFAVGALWGKLEWWWYRVSQPKPPKTPEALRDRQTRSGEE